MTKSEPSEILEECARLSEKSACVLTTQTVRKAKRHGSAYLDGWVDACEILAARIRELKK